MGVIRKRTVEKIEDMCIFISIRLGVIIGEAVDKQGVTQDEAKSLVLATAEIINKYK